MSKGLPRSLKRANDKKLSGYPINGATSVADNLGGTIRETITLKDITVALIDNPGVVAYTFFSFYKFNDVVYNFIGASIDFTIFADAAGVISNFAGDIAIGTDQNLGNNVMLNREDNIIISKNTPTAINSLISDFHISDGSNTNKILGNTLNENSLFLNILIDDTDHDVTTIPTNLILNGTIIVTYAPFSNKTDL